LSQNGYGGLAVSGRWADYLSAHIKYDEGNWLLLRFFGAEIKQQGFDYRNMCNAGKEAIRCVAAVSRTFHRLFPRDSLFGMQISEDLGGPL
jgi:hypothetical protein